MYRIDLIFSYWVTLWWVLYLAKLVKTSPKFAILLGIVENLVTVVVFLLYAKKTAAAWNTLSLFLTQFSLKFIPWITLWNETVVWNREIVATGCLFLVYSGWLLINGENPWVIYMRIYRVVLGKENMSPKKHRLCIGYNNTVNKYRQKI